jgi:hypothetical protein
MEKERGLGLLDQRRDVADIDRLVQVDQFAVLAQAIEKLAEIFLHCQRAFQLRHPNGRGHYTDFGHRSGANLPVRQDVYSKNSSPDNIFIPILLTYAVLIV